MGKPRHRLEDNIKMDLPEMGWRGMDGIGLAQDRDRWWALVNAVMNLHVSLDAGNFLTSSGPVSFSRRTFLHGVSCLVDWFVGLDSWSVVWLVDWLLVSPDHGGNEKDSNTPTRNPTQASRFY